MKFRHIQDVVDQWETSLNSITRLAAKNNRFNPLKALIYFRKKSFVGYLDINDDAKNQTTF